MMHNDKDSVLEDLTKTYLQISELYHGNVSDCMKQCKEVHPHLSQDECKEQYCKESMTTQGNVQESHKHEELVKLSIEELKELENEYARKAKEAKGEEKEHHEKELADIRSILDSRKTESKEEVSEAFDKLKKKVGRAIETMQGLVGLKVNKDTYRTPSGKKLDPLYYKRDLQKDGPNVTRLITPAEKKKRMDWYHSGRQAGWSKSKKEEGTQMEAKEVLKAMKEISERVSYKKRLAEESNEDHIAHHLSNAQNHWNHMEKGYDSDAVPHMKKAKALLHKATPEEQKRYKFIMDRLDKPHREAIGEEYGQENLADKVVTNAEEIKRLKGKKGK